MLSLSRFFSSTYVSEGDQTLLSNVRFLREMDIIGTMPYKSTIYTFYKWRRILLDFFKHIFILAYVLDTKSLVIENLVIRMSSI